MANPWDNDPIAPANDPAFSGYIPGVPKPKEPKDVTTWAVLAGPDVAKAGLDPNFTWQRSSSGEIKKVGDAGDPGKDLLQDATKDLGVTELLTNVQRAREAIKTGHATGMTGAILSAIPGTSATDFRGYIEAIQGGIINEKLAALKAASKTGASGLGALSEKEGERLAASVAAIKPNMSDQALNDSLDEIERHSNFLRAVADGKDPRDPNVAKEYKLNLVAAGAAPPLNETGGTSGDGPPGASMLTDAQKRDTKAWLAANPNFSDTDLGDFLGKMLGKKVANAPELAKAWRATGEINPTVRNLTQEQRVQQRLALEDKAGNRSNPVETLAVQGATGSLSDEAAGVGNALAGVVTAPFTGKLDPVGDYKLGRDVERQRIDNAREQLGYGGSAIEFVSGLAMARPGSFVGPLRAIDAARQAGTAGVVGGALSGFGSGEGAGESTAGAAVGGAVGGALGRYAPAAVERILPNRLRQSPALNPELARAADAEGVDINRAMVDPRAVPEYGALESNRFSQPVIRQAAENTRGQISGRVEALGGGGNPLDNEAAGTILQSSGRRFIQRSRNVANRLYDRARSLAGDARFEPTQAIAQVDNELAQLQANPSTNAGEINFLQGLREDLATPGGKSVDELRQLRTSLRGRISEQNLGATQAEARAIRALDATQQDVAANAPQAASAFRRADSYYRERQTHIDDIIERVTGGRVGNANFTLSGEDAFRKIRGMAQNDGRRLAALMRDLEPGERQDIAATFAQSLGRDAPDEPFSAAKFLIQTRKLSPSARRTIFGPDGAQSIQNLRTLSQALKDAGQDINQSRSGTYLERAGWRRLAGGLITSLSGLGGGGGAMAGGLSGGVTGAVAGAAVGGAAMGATAVAKRLSARAMVNPRVSRWLADAVNVRKPAAGAGSDCAS
jgi:hypothetical protein